MIFSIRKSQPQYDAGSTQEQRFIAESFIYGNNLQSIVEKGSSHDNGSTVDKQRLLVEKQELADILEEIDFKFGLNRDASLRNSYQNCQQNTYQK